MTHPDAWAGYEADQQAEYIDILKAELAAARAEVRALLHIRKMIEAERDAAHAEVDEWRQSYIDMGRERDAAHDKAQRLSAEVAALRALVADGVEAFRLTKEYVNVPDENGFVLLPDVEGWSHWDWTVRARAVLEEES